VQQRAQRPRDRVRLVGDLAPGAADDPEAAHLQVGVAAAIGLEGAAGEVRGGAVELGDEALRAPEDVDLVAADALVCTRALGGPPPATRERKRSSSSLRVIWGSA
jgi:hypothetical protein